MSDAVTEADRSEIEGPAPEVDREADLANLRNVATIHAVMLLGALTLWGAADAWAVATDWGLAWFVALANAVIAGHVVASTLHEWGHFAGARLSGSVSPVLKEPVRYFFMFNFSFDENDRRQFLWMSWGGILVPWALVLLAPALLPIDNPSRAMLLAVLVTRAVQVSAFEVPVVMRTRAGGDPREELGRELQAGFGASRTVGVVVGAMVWLLA